MSLKSKCRFWIIVRLNVIARVVLVLTETGVDSHVREVDLRRTSTGSPAHSETWLKDNGIFNK